jgi:DNA-binding CsgD family transcriptional regulator/tetratricopeptide (TPR) repeat protein
MGSPFVGRKSELATLKRLLGESRAGRGLLATIAGEAGIGKTRLMSEFAAIADAGGNRVLWSQMVEDPVAPPYLPWLLALRGYVQQAEDESLVADLGSGAAAVADILPELRDRLRLPASRPPQESDSARFQLFDSVTRFLLAVARRKPLVVLFDNLHLAGRSSLLLLEYFVRQLTATQILVIAAHRDAEVGQSHPLREALGRLSRTAGYETLPLAGLAPEEVAELLSLTLESPVPPALVEAVRRRGDGNPLFVGQVAAGLARRETTLTAATSDGHFGIPDSLREVIARRLAAVDPEALDALRVAAVTGRDFDGALLARLCPDTETPILLLIQRAADAAIVSAVGPGRFRFQHALFREVLYAELGADQRLRLHQTAAEALQQLSDRDPHEHAQRLAYHWFEAARGGYRAEAVEWARRAAALAVERRAYGEAAGHLERAIQLLDLHPAADTSLRFGLLGQLGQAYYWSGQPGQADRACLGAALLAHRHRWPEKLAEAVVAWQYVRASTGVSHLSSVPLHKAALEMLPPGAVGTRARLLASLALAYRHRDELTHARSTLDEAIRTAREVDDPEVLFACLSKAWYVYHRAYEAPRQLPVLEEALVLARSSDQPENVLFGLSAVMFPLAKLGHAAKLRAPLDELESLAEAARHPFYRQVATGFRAMLAILGGRWQQGLEWGRRSVEQGSTQGLSGLEGRFSFQVFAIQRALGRLRQLSAILEQVAAAGDRARTWLPGRILLHCELGQKPQARDALTQLGEFGRLVDDDLYETSLAYLADACVSLGDTARCRELFEIIKPYRGFNLLLHTSVIHGPAADFLARLALQLGRRAEAARLFDEALELEDTMGARPIRARTQVDYAALLASNGRAADEARARRMLAEAAAVASELGMQPLLERVAALGAGRGVPEGLSERELAVLRLIAAGASNKRIASELCLSTATVATHIRNILRKTGTSNRTEAVSHARRAGVLFGD